MEYDKITAFHYASYRPPLHLKVLKKTLGEKLYNSGLDIGCGTGESSIALSEFCNHVVGIDSSSDMLSKGKRHAKISYSFIDKTQINFKDASFNIITLAGSLWYAKSQQLLDEIVRVSDTHSKILIYDFQVFLEDVLGRLGFEKQESVGDYNHQENFFGLYTGAIKKLNEGHERVQIEMTAKELAHLILSVKEQYLFFEELYGSGELFTIVVEKISSDSRSKSFNIQADTFFTLYQIK